MFACHVRSYVTPHLAVHPSPMTTMTTMCRMIVAERKRTSSAHAGQDGVSTQRCPAVSRPQSLLSTGGQCKDTGHQQQQQQQQHEKLRARRQHEAAASNGWQLDRSVDRSVFKVTLAPVQDFGPGSVGLDSTGRLDRSIERPSGRCHRRRHRGRPHHPTPGTRSRRRSLLLARRRHDAGREIQELRVAGSLPGSPIASGWDRAIGGIAASGYHRGDHAELDRQHWHQATAAAAAAASASASFSLRLLSSSSSSRASSPSSRQRAATASTALFFFYFFFFFQHRSYHATTITDNTLRYHRANRAVGRLTG